MVETVLLGTVLQQVARHGGEELQRLSVGADPRNAAKASLKQMKGRVLRLSLLLHEYRADGCFQPHEGPLQALAALERVEGSSANFDHCMSQLEFMRRDCSAGRALRTCELCDSFATHQPPVRIAAGLLQGLAMDGRLGAPAALADALLGGDFRMSHLQRCAAERRWRLGVRAALARSGLAQALAAAELHLSLEPDFALTLDAPGAFVLRLQYDLRRWLVLHCSLSSQDCELICTLSAETAGNFLLRPRSADSDVPAALATAAHFFCSHLWLQACCDEARVAHGRLREVSSTFWDRRGFASLRILPDWESTCGGICAAPAASSTRASTDETQGPASGITLELHKVEQCVMPVPSSLRGLCPSLPPEFASLPVQRPSRLASLGGVGPCLDEVLRQAHAAVSAVTMRRLRVGLLQVVPSKRAPLLDESQAAQRAAEREYHFFQAVAKGFSFIQDKWNQMIASVCVCHVSILLRGYLQPL
eukprot:s994_g3.t1